MIEMDSQDHSFILHIILFFFLSKINNYAASAVMSWGILNVDLHGKELTGNYKDKGQGTKLFRFNLRGINQLPSVQASRWYGVGYE